MNHHEGEMCGNGVNPQTNSARLAPNGAVNQNSQFHPPPPPPKLTNEGVTQQLLAKAREEPTSDHEERLRFWKALVRDYGHIYTTEQLVHDFKLLFWFRWRHPKKIPYTGSREVGNCWEAKIVIPGFFEAMPARQSVPIQPTDESIRRQKEDENQRLKGNMEVTNALAYTVPQAGTVHDSSEEEAEREAERELRAVPNQHIIVFRLGEGVGARADFLAPEPVNQRLCNTPYHIQRIPSSFVSKWSIAATPKPTDAPLSSIFDRISAMTTVGKYAKVNARPIQKTFVEPVATSDPNACSNYEDYGDDDSSSLSSYEEKDFPATKKFKREEEFVAIAHGMDQQTQYEQPARPMLSSSPRTPAVGAHSFKFKSGVTSPDKLTEDLRQSMRNMPSTVKSTQSTVKQPVEPSRGQNSGATKKGVISQLKAPSAQQASKNTIARPHVGLRPIVSSNQDLLPSDPNQHKPAHYHQSTTLSHGENSEAMKNTVAHQLVGLEQFVGSYDRLRAPQALYQHTPQTIDPHQPVAFSQGHLVAGDAISNQPQYIVDPRLAAAYSTSEMPSMAYPSSDRSHIMALNDSIPGESNQTQSYQPWQPNQTYLDGALSSGLFASGSNHGPPQTTTSPMTSSSSHTMASNARVLEASSQTQGHQIGHSNQAAAFPPDSAHGLSQPSPMPSDQHQAARYVHPNLQRMGDHILTMDTFCMEIRTHVLNRVPRSHVMNTLYQLQTEIGRLRQSLPATQAIIRPTPALGGEMYERLQQIEYAAGYIGCYHDKAVVEVVESTMQLLDTLLKQGLWFRGLLLPFSLPRGN